MLILRGVTETGDIIVNDPGTQHGESYVYPRAIFMNALHDWNHADDATLPASGIPVAIIIE
jgi:hypothetical protein